MKIGRVRGWMRGAMLAGVLIAGLGSIGVGSALAQVSRWVDEQGGLHVTDNPNEIPPRFRSQPPPAIPPPASGAALSTSQNVPLTDSKTERNAYRTSIARLFEAGHFDELEARAAALRKERPRFSSGLPVLYDFYRAFDPSAEHVASTKRAEYLERSVRWAQRSPGSLPAKIAVIYAHLYRGWKARGRGYANTVTEEGWRQFRSELTAAWEVAKEAERLGVVDPALFDLEIDLCTLLGKSRAEMELALEKGITVDPSFDQLYVAVADYLLPRWHGSGPELHAFALRAVERSKKEMGGIMYVRVATVGMMKERDTFKSVYPFDWARLKQAFTELDKRHPNSARTLNYFCWFAWHYGDQATARALLKRLDNQWTPDSVEVWKDRATLEQAQRWAASSPSQPKGASAPAPSPGSGFAGRWESTGTSRGGLGGGLDLAEDGTAVGGIVVLVDGDYTLQGTRLTVRHADEAKPTERKVTVDGDTMSVGGQSQKLHRVGTATPGVSPIVGVWKYTDDSGETAFVRYTADGRTEFRLPILAMSSRWAVADGTLTLTRPDGSSERFEAGVEGDVLTLKGLPDGKPETLRRADRWYDFPASDAHVPKPRERVPRGVASGQGKELATVDGPEATGLMGQLQGQIVMPEPVGGILTTLLPSLERKTVRPPGKHPAVYDLSGPDRNGRLAVVESAPSGAVLRIVRLDGTDAGEVMRRPDKGFLSRAIGRPALSPAGGLVAFAGNTRSVDMPVEPRTTFDVGALEVWDTSRNRRLELSGEVIDRSIAWFPDAKGFVYSELIAPDTLPKEWFEAYHRAAFGKDSSAVPLAEGRVPVVHRVDLATKEKRPLCIGRRSVLSTDGKTLLVQGIGLEWMAYDVASGKLREATWPGLYDRDSVGGVYEGGPIALVGTDLVIYWGLPTTGAPKRMTEHNSPLVGEKGMPSIKVARLGTGQFQTLIPYVDPRRRVSYGHVREASAASREALQATRKTKIESFGADKKALADRVNSAIDGLNASTDYHTAAAKVKTARELIGEFSSRYWIVADEPSIRPLLDSVQKLERALKELEEVLNRERANAERIAHLTEHQRAPAGARDPSAHPFVFLANVQASTERLQAAGRERAALLVTIRQMAGEFAAAAPFTCEDKNGGVTSSDLKCDDNVKAGGKGDKARARQTAEDKASSAPYELRLPTRDWSVVLDIPGYVIRTEQMRPDQRGRVMDAENEQTGMVLSIFLEREPQATDARACRDRYWRRALQSPVPKAAIRPWETDTMALGQYLIDEVGGARVRQKHVNAYMGVADVCIDVHLSKVQYTEQDEPLFAAVLESMRLKTTGSTKTSPLSPPPQTGSPSVGGQGARRFPVLGSGSLELSVPASWRDEVGPSPAGLPPTISFHPVSGRDFEVLITPIPMRNRSLRDPDVLRRQVEAEGRSQLPTAVEDRIVLGEIRGAAAVGYFYSLTDKAPKPGEYEFMTRGTAVVGDLVLSVTILSHTKDSPSVRDALSMLRGSRQTDVPAAGKR